MRARQAVPVEELQLQLSEHHVARSQLSLAPGQRTRHAMHPVEDGVRQHRVCHARMTTLGGNNEVAANRHAVLLECIPQVEHVLLDVLDLRHVCFEVALGLDQLHGSAAQVEQLGLLVLDRAHPKVQRQRACNTLVEHRGSKGNSGAEALTVHHERTHVHSDSLREAKLALQKVRRLQIVDQVNDLADAMIVLSRDRFFRGDARLVVELDVCAVLELGVSARAVNLVDSENDVPVGRDFAVQAQIVGSSGKVAVRKDHGLQRSSHLLRGVKDGVLLGRELDTIGDPIEAANLAGLHVMLHDACVPNPGLLVTKNVLFKPNVFILHFNIPV